MTASTCIVANDGTANYLFRNLGEFRFQEIGLQAGVAGGAQGGYQAGMGVACGDLDGDGRPDLMVTNFYGEGTTLYQNLGSGLFADRSAASGIGLATRYLLGFGIAMADVTNDGLLDVMITNGHVNDNPAFICTRCRAGCMKIGLTGIWWTSRLAPEPPGTWCGSAAASRRATSTTTAGSMPSSCAERSGGVLPNKSSRVGHFLTLRLEGTKSHKDAVAARVTLKAGANRQARTAREAAAISRQMIRGCISAWVKAIAANRSRSTGPPEKSTSGTTSPRIPATWREGEAKLLPLDGFAARKDDAPGQGKKP